MAAGVATHTHTRARNNNKAAFSQLKACALSLSLANSRFELYFKNLTDFLANLI